MRWCNKEVSTLSDEELAGADQILDGMLENYHKKLAHPRAEKLFKGQPPPSTNLSFVTLQDEIKAEIAKRKKEKENVVP